MYQQQVDPIYTQIYANITGCNYGAYQNSVLQQVYVFLKQYTSFKVAQTSMQYSNGAQVKCLCVTGSLSITYKSQNFTIPLNIVLPSGFPTTGPKVYLTYKLDKESVKNNPLIINESEVMNNYIHKWEANNPSYTLGGLCYNLAKSFEMYPPLGEAESKSVMSSISSATSSLVDSVKTTVSKATNGKVFKENLAESKVQTAPPPDVKTPEMEAREELVAKVTQKLISLKELSSSIPNGGSSEPCSALCNGTKSKLEENGMKLQKQILVLEGEMQEMKTRSEEMKDFISKNAEKEVTKDNIDDFVAVKEEDHKSMLDEIKAKESALEDTFDLCKKSYRKKKIDLSTYLDTVRELSEEQFLNLAMRQKILSVLSSIPRQQTA